MFKKLFHLNTAKKALFILFMSSSKTIS